MKDSNSRLAPIVIYINTSEIPKVNRKIKQVQLNFCLDIDGAASSFASPPWDLLHYQFLMPWIATYWVDNS